MFLFVALGDVDIRERHVGRDFFRFDVACARLHVFSQRLFEGGRIDAFERRPLISKSFGHLSVAPITKSKHPRLDTLERILTLRLLAQRVQSRPHRHLWALAHVALAPLFDRDIRDVYIVE